MYAKKIKIVNYGPIDYIDIEFPFEGERPKPVVLVGENGSGKSILLSHVVNLLISAKDLVYSETPEVDLGKVYKLRSGSYIKSGREFYFTRVDFEDDIFSGEIRSRRSKKDYSDVPEELSRPDMQKIWNEMSSDSKDHYGSNIHENENKVKDLFSKNCALYFPPNRFEEPAWLNETNLQARAEYMDMKHLKGHTSRKLISYSSLHDNQNWLFDLIYDRAAFESGIASTPYQVKDRVIHIPAQVVYSGNATNMYEIALKIVRNVIGEDRAIRFGIGGRLNRVVSLEEESGQVVPNIFQLSTGETSLLSLFLSILRDFDLCGTSFNKAEDVRGIAVVDEIDLHLHAIHQYEILPKLIRMFPKVQFLITTHSPLFVLGMNKLFGENGFALYHLPSGKKISPEEFGEFESAYQSFTETTTFSADIRRAIESTQKPVVLVEGITDLNYLRKAGILLGRKTFIDRVELMDGGGKPKLKKIGKMANPLFDDLTNKKVVLLYDYDCSKSSKNSGNVFSLVIPFQSDHPIKKGIENLFEKETLEKAQQHKAAFIDVDETRRKTERGERKVVPEEWTVNKDEKMNLCNWLCENGTEGDFRHFREVFDLLEEAVGAEQAESTDKRNER